MTDTKEQKELKPSEDSSEAVEKDQKTATADPETDEYATDFEDEKLVDLYEESFKNIAEGEVVIGKILQITENEVLVDVGYKSEGAIPLVEFQSVLEEGSLKIGDEIDVYLEKTEDSDGLVVLSKEKADKIKIWDQIQKAYENEEILKGKVIERIKGGLNVDIGVKAFLPGSQIDLRPVRDPQGLIGQVLEMKVIKLNKRRGNIVLSRRAILENQRKKQKEKTMSTLKENAVVTGVVKNITEYGAFIDLGGIDGLLHITDMSWGRVNHPSELFMIGDKVEVVVLKFDREKERVSLGYKQKSADPWETVDEKYPVESKVRGKVISITDYGAFVELEEGVEGLVHVSEMSWSRRIRNHSKIVAIGDTVEAVVLSLDKENKRISLGMKQVEPNPWKLIEEKYSVGAEVTGRVRNLTNFGAFIELDEGVDGLVHISDMSWTKRINHPSEVLKKGERVKAVILDIDAKNERLSLGIKQLQPDPWDTIQDRYPAGSILKGKVVRISEFGAFVELEDGIEGLVHVSELDRKHVNNPEDIVKIDEEYTMKVIKIDPYERKIGLSIKAYLESLDQKDVADYIQKQEKEQEKAKIGDVIEKAEIQKAAVIKEEAIPEQPQPEPDTEEKVAEPVPPEAEAQDVVPDSPVTETEAKVETEEQAPVEEIAETKEHVETEEQVPVAEIAETKEHVESKEKVPAEEIAEAEEQAKPATVASEEVEEQKEEKTEKPPAAKKQGGVEPKDQDVEQVAEEEKKTTTAKKSKAKKDSKTTLTKLDDADSMISKIKGSVQEKKKKSSE